MTAKPPSLANLAAILAQMTRSPMSGAPANANGLAGLLISQSAAAPQPAYRVSENDPALLKIRLNQLVYDRGLATKNGVDTGGPGYSSINAEIRMLRDQIKGK